MTQEHIKIFSGTSIFVNRLKSLLAEAGIHSVVKDHVNSGQLAGFGTLRGSIELFILNTDFEKGKGIIENFKEEIA